MCVQAKPAQYSHFFGDLGSGGRPVLSPPSARDSQGQATGLGLGPLAAGEAQDDRAKSKTRAAGGATCVHAGGVAHVQVELALPRQSPPFP